jgi:hypothetical protein
VILGANAAEPHEILARESERFAQGLQMLVDEARRKTIVPRVDRRVRREHGALRDFLRTRFEIGVRHFHAQARRLERRERAVPFVQVEHAPIDATGAERADSADAEQQFLANAHPLISEIETRRELPIFHGVSVDIAVEQEEMIAPDVHLPHLGTQRLARRQLDFDDDGTTIGAARGNGGHRFGRRANVFRVLHAVAIEALAKIRLAIKQAHGDERQAEIGRALQVITGEHAESAAINRKRLV